MNSLAKISLMLILTVAVANEKSDADEVFSHIGASDPIANDWLDGGFGTGVTVSPVVNDLGLGIDAWSIEDGSSAPGSAVQYRQVPSAEVNDEAAALGWSAKIIMRFLDASGSANPMFFQYRNNTDQFTLLFDMESDLDPTVSFADQSFTLEGAGNDEYLSLIHI